MNKRASGYNAEQLAAEYLKSEGFRIICRNHRCAGVEIDIIAADGKELVFVEVKSSEYAAAHPSEHVTPWQMRRYVRAAREYVAARGLFGVNVRFDVAEVVGGDVRLIRGAFDATTA